MRFRTTRSPEFCGRRVSAEILSPRCYEKKETLNGATFAAPLLRKNMNCATEKKYILQFNLMIILLSGQTQKNKIGSRLLMCFALFTSTWIILQISGHEHLGLN